jgi:hypothetical protein
VKNVNAFTHCSCEEKIAEIYGLLQAFPDAALKSACLHELTAPAKYGGKLPILLFRAFGD